jgi:hypothetical protein
MDPLLVTLGGGGHFALAFSGGFLVKLTAAGFGQNTRFLAGAFEAPHGGFKRLVFSDTD